MTDKAIDSIDFSKFTDNKPLIAAVKMFVGRKHVDDIVDLTIDMFMAITAYKLAENELKMTDNKVTQSKAIEAAKGDGWRPISELKHGGRVLYKRKGSKTVKVGWLTSSKEFLGDDGRLECGAMWQPLPTPPTKAEKDQ